MGFTGRYALLKLSLRLGLKLSWILSLFLARKRILMTFDYAEMMAKLSENGIRLTNSHLTLKSPLGEQSFQIDADIATFDAFKAEIKLPLSNLSYNDISAKGAGLVTLESADGEIRVQGQTQTESLSNSKYQIANAALTLDGRVKVETKSYTGRMSLNGQKLSGEGFAAETAQILWDGTANLDKQLYSGKYSAESMAISGDKFTADRARIEGDGIANLETRSYDGKLSVESQAISSALIAADAAHIKWDGKLSNAEYVLVQGQWSISTDKARTPRAARAAELAETLSLFPALSVVPVTEHYAPDLKQTVEKFLLGADVKGQGGLEYGPEGFKLTPDGAMRIENSENKLRLSPRPGLDFFAFDAAKQSVLAQMDGAFDIPVGLMLTDIELRAKSKNGVSLGGVNKFSANLETAENWTALDAEDARAVRLGPLSTALEYRGDANPDVRLYEDRQVLDFTPLENSQITVRTMETPTAWFGEDMRFTLASTTNLFTRTASESIVAAKLESADFKLTQPATTATEAQRLDVKAAALDLKGSLFPNLTQDWDVGFEDVRYDSDTLPGPGTSAVAAQANLTARLMPDQSPQITLNSPSVTTETPSASLSNFAISLTGTPDNYSVEHKGGSVDVISPEFVDLAEMAGLSSFPADGRVEFVDGRFVGKANLVVAKADDAAVNVAYEFANGAGRADIDIPSILFSPKGLQPQTLVPAFSGKIAQVEGEARAKIKIAFAGGELTDSSGTVQLVDMAVGTAL